MAQGFKISKANSSKKQSSSNSSKTKRGPKVIAPKKHSSIQQAIQKRKQNASLTKKIESEMAGRASGGGPLTIMKKLGNEVKQQKEKEKRERIEKQKLKVRSGD